MKFRKFSLIEFKSGRKVCRAYVNILGIQVGEINWIKRADVGVLIRHDIIISRLTSLVIINENSLYIRKQGTAFCEYERSD